jgi:hypothetical protein
MKKKLTGFGDCDKLLANHLSLVEKANKIVFDTHYLTSFQRQNLTAKWVLSVGAAETILL